MRAFDTFYKHSVKWEGKTPFTYLDAKGWVTTGIGYLADTSGWDQALGRTVPPGWNREKKSVSAEYLHLRPWEPYLELPFLFKNDDPKSGFRKDQPASVRQKIIEWCFIWGSNEPNYDESIPLEYDPQKNIIRRQRLADAQHGGFYFDRFCKLYLPEEAIMDLTAKKAASNAVFLGRRFGPLEKYPVSVEMALHFLSWAAGPAFRFSRFVECLRKKEYAIYVDKPDGSRVLVGGCAIECHLDETGNSGVKPRNKAMQQLFEEAQAVTNMGLDPDVLFFPDPVIAEFEPRSAPPDAPSQLTDADDTAPYVPMPESTLRGLGAQNPDFINQAVKQSQDEQDKKRSDDET